MQAGGSNDSVNVRMPAGITRLFKSELDWNLYTNRQEGVNGRRVRPTPQQRQGQLLGDRGVAVPGNSSMHSMTLPVCKPHMARPHLACACKTCRSQQIMQAR